MSNELLEDITSRDPIRVWSSSCAIIKLRDADQLDYLASKLETIRESARNLSLGGSLFPNAQHLSFAVRKLEFQRSHAGCLCALYSEYLFYDPEQEANAGNVLVEEITYIKEKWIDTYRCRCTSCGQRYRVEEGESHYTWWRWKAE
jgi:hypothetical protein